MIPRQFSDEYDPEPGGAARSARAARSAATITPVMVALAIAILSDDIESPAARTLAQLTLLAAEQQAEGTAR
jgi:hypothetical protein